MVLEILVRYVHFICIFTIAACLTAEHLMLKKQMMRSEIQRLAGIDGIYGIASILLLVAGLTMWFAVGKPAEFYSRNWVFHLKLGLFLTIGLLSISPTVFFLKNRKGIAMDQVDIPPGIIRLVRLELIILLLIPFLAILMARGIGRF